MIRWLSHYWISRSVDRGLEPSKLWRWTFGRLESNRRVASELRQLHGQLKKQAASQRRAIGREPFPIGHYSKPAAQTTRGADNRHTPRLGLFSTGPGWLKPTLMAGSLTAVLGLATLGVVIWSNTPTRTPEELRLMATHSFDRVWQPLSRQAEATGRALREQTMHVTQLPERLPAMDQVVNEWSEAIQAPIREEVQRFTDDLTKPWIYLAGQLPRLPREQPADTSPLES